MSPPNSLDTSTAQVSYSTSAKTLTITGIKSFGGTLILIR